MHWGYFSLIPTNLSSVHIHSRPCTHRPIVPLWSPKTKDKLSYRMVQTALRKKRHMLGWLHSIHWETNPKGRLLMIKFVIGPGWLVKLLTLGARGDLPSGYIVGLLWVLKQFAQSLPSRYVVSSFKKYSPKYPLGTFWTRPLSSFQKNPSNYPAGTFWTNSPSSFKKYPSIWSKST